MLAVDSIGSAIAILGLKKNKRISQITEELHKTSKFLENALTRRIQNRMLKAFPDIEPAAATAEEKERPEVFAEGCSFYKLVSLFFIGAFLGDIVETIFCLITSCLLYTSRPQEIWEDMKDYRRRESGMYTRLRRQNLRFGCLLKNIYFNLENLNHFRNPIRYY